MIEVPGVGPTRLPEVYEREESTPSKEADSSPTDRYIEILHNRTSM
jgi:hypothetical protein